MFRLVNYSRWSEKLIFSTLFAWFIRLCLYSSLSKHQGTLSVSHTVFFVSMMFYAWFFPLYIQTHSHILALYRQQLFGLVQQEHRFGASRLRRTTGWCNKFRMRPSETTIPSLPLRCFRCVAVRQLHLNHGVELG
jgi:hypothetical protein